MLRRLAEFGDQCSSADAYALADPSLVESCVPMAAEVLGRRGRWREAIALSDAYRSYIRRHYGEEMLTAAGIAAALAESSKRMPMDVLFPLWFEGMRDSVEAGGQAPDSAALQAIIQIGKEFCNHPRQGARLRKLAFRAGRLCADKAPPIWSSSVSYTLPKDSPR